MPAKFARATPPELVGGCCALGAFAIAIIAGLATDVATDDILLRAVISMIACWCVGALIGHAGQRAVDEGVARRIEAQTLPLDEPEQSLEFQPAEPVTARSESEGAAAEPARAAA